MNIATRKELDYIAQICQLIDEEKDTQRNEMICLRPHRPENQTPAALALSTVLFPLAGPRHLSCTQYPSRPLLGGLRWAPKSPWIGLMNCLPQLDPQPQGSFSSRAGPSREEGNSWLVAIRSYPELQPKDCKGQFGRNKGERERRMEVNQSTFVDVQKSKKTLTQVRNI